MKIGIITFHRAHNYGAVLQCYALSHILKSLGAHVDIIDYYPSYFKEEYAFFPKKKFLSFSLKSKISFFIKFLLTIVPRYRRYKGFNQFIKRLPLSSVIYDQDSKFPELYDCIFWGSDQVWNPLLTCGEDRFFAGNFTKGNTRFIAYAASTSPRLLNMKYREYFCDIISRFDNISTREVGFCQYLNNLQKGCALNVLDPVLLLKKSAWEQLSKRTSLKDYLLIYTVPQNRKIYQIATKIARKKNLRIIEIRPSVILSFRQNLLQDSSPNEFLGLFLNSSFVVTTSFHGTAFSVKFQKNFITLKMNSDIDARASNLLTSLDLTDRLVDDYDDNVIDNNINYAVVDQKLNILINDSFNYIRNSLNENFVD